MRPTRHRPSARLLLGAVAAAAVVAVTGGCGVPDDREFRTVPEEGLPFGLDTPVTRPGPGANEQVEAVSLVFTSRAGLMPVSRPMRSPVSLGDVVDALDDGPAESDPPSLRTIVDRELVRSVYLDAGVANVALTPAVAQLTAADQRLLVAQLVLTMTGRPGVGQVRFTVGAQGVDVPRADGSLVSGPVARDDYASMLVGG